MVQRRLPTVTLMVATLVLGVVGTTGGPSATAATTVKPGNGAEPPNPRPAVPNGPKAMFPMAGFGPNVNDNVALKWSEQTLGMIRMSSLPPTAVSRALAVVQTSVYDAWAAYDPIAVGTRLGGTLRRPAQERTERYKSMAISYAAYRALLDLFPAPAQQSANTEFFESLGYDPDDESIDPQSAAGVGNLAAAAVLAARRNDGSNQHGEKGGAAYSDYTGYTPVNTYDKLVDQWRWQPLLISGAAKPQTFATPQWGRVTPFALASPGQFTVPGPDLRKDYRKAVQDIVKFSAQLTDTDKAIAGYWSDGPRSELPPGHGAIFAAALCRMRGNNLDNDVKLLFLQANAVLDAGIAAWHYKVKYDFVRPITLVRLLNKGQKIKAWGGPGRGTVWMQGEQWQPYQPTDVVTPPFAEYVSGHSTFSGAGFEVLRSFTGADTLNLSVTIPKGQSRVEPGVTPAKDITLSWKTMQDAADQAGLSREFGGIHFRDGDLDGRALGVRIGAAVYQKAQTYFKGTAQG
jgi:hypothetical protein